VRTNGWMDGNTSKTVYLPVSLRSLGGYNKQRHDDFHVLFGGIYLKETYSR